MDNLTWLTLWYESRCDGEWESEFGITIQSVNNPGWMVTIDLDGTGLDPTAFRAVANQRTPTDWVECKVEDGVWLGGGGIANLDEVIGLFRAWVESGGRAGAGRPAGRKPEGGGLFRGGNDRGGPRGGPKPWQKKHGGPRR